ncbi:redoxin domain-containing protein [Pseudohongiella spirulinae]|uniref:EF-hand domain-containing protein n=1 Tax=Pseudohongiella spirulinae TaxID=1249552 RepID=A0A0S2KGU5_9GAMM|nr:redoxin domain-containing protein [Pseudohongiella spirulinae]ALO47252.1 hypothetical protein PS2015_2620 [Pseudohongiella spirulinae]
MSIVRSFVWLTFTVFSLQAAAQSSETVSRAADFTLIDHQGKAFNLHYHAQRPAIVLIGHAEGSSDALQAAKALEARNWQGRGLVAALVNPDSQSSRQSSAELARQHDVALPVLMDTAGLIANTYQLSHVGETLVIDPRRWQIVYRGPAIDAGSIHPQLQATVEALLAEQDVTPATVPMLAADPLPDVTHSSTIASYSETIAPLLVEKCADCHRPGGIGPWAMTSHAMIQGFSPMIRETILTRRMPPWHADPEIGEFEHDLSLSTAEQRQVVAWIDAGAPRGDGPDPLAEVAAVDTEWEMGEPDLIVTLPAFDVPATGVLDYQFFEVKNPLDRDVWVKAVQIAPGDRQVLHHAIATFGASSSFEGQVDSGESLLQPQLMTFVPGNETYIYPENTGVYVPADSSFYTQMHYTTYGRETRDETRIGLYFADEAPEHVLQHYSILNLGLEIPPGVAEHEEAAYYQLQRDAVIYALFPHAHYRGRASEFAIRYPDGNEEIVLSVPDYDFNWQRYFQFKDPIEVPAGSMVIHRTTYDNSTANLSNPDSSIAVNFGEQTWEEMLYGGISFRYAEPGENDFEINVEDYLTAVVMGYMDKEMKGQIALSDMPESSRQSLALPFTILDRDKSGGLDFDEFRQLMIQTNMTNERSIMD